MVMLWDGREQQRLLFPAAIPQREATLPVGDYMCEVNGVRLPVAFERKSLQDLFSTIAQGHDRFRQELLAAQEHGIALILGIETTFRHVKEGSPYSALSGEQALKVIFTWWCKYGLRPVFCDGRRELAKYILETFSALERQWEKA